MVIICENFTLSEVEMPYLRHLRAFKTAPLFYNSLIVISNRHFTTFSVNSAK